MPWLVAPLLVLRLFALALPTAALFILASSLIAPVIEDPRLRLAVGLLSAAVPALLLRWRVARFLARRLSHLPWIAFVNLVLTAGLVLGFADDAGRALRRHGDWFIGQRNGFVARTLRSAIGAAAGALERVDPVPELAAVPAARPSPYVFPLAIRVLPANESQRFGAERPQPRPVECELGHCGVDLVGPVGLPVHAVADGVVVKIERDAFADPRSGRYVVLAHDGGAAGTRYIHLDEVGIMLRPGDAVVAGQIVGRLGATGVKTSAPHLHFALTVRRGDRDVFVDPEPLMRTWPLPPADAAAATPRIGSPAAPPT